MPEQTADDAAFDPLSAHGKAKRREEIKEDVVVVARVERDVIAADFRDSADHIERLVAIERRDLDGDDVLDPGKAPPERVRQHASAHRRLKVEAEQREDFGNAATVVKQFVLARVAKRTKTEQTRVEAQFAGKCRFSERLLCLPADPGNPELLTSAAAKFRSRQFEHGFEQSDFR